MKVDGKGDNPGRGQHGPMANQRHPPGRVRDPPPSMTRNDQDQRDRELDAWMDRAVGARKPDPQPIVRDL